MLTKTRTTLISLIAAASFATAAIAPAVSQADKAKPAPAVTCDGGFQPGDIVENTYTRKVNGKPDIVETTKEICGKDGKWHTVSNLEISKTSKVSKLTKEVSVEVSKTSVARAVGQRIAVGASLG